MRKTMRRCMKEDMIKWVIAITMVLAISFCIGTGAVYADTDNHNGTMTDSSGLVWLKNANCFFGGRAWYHAISLAENLQSGQCGLNDGSTAGQWRLPTKDELRFRALNPAGFYNVQSEYYWSSTEISYTDQAWYVYMNTGGQGVGSKGDNHYVWPVRSGQ